MDAAQGLSCEFNRKGAHGLVFPAKFGQLLGWLEVTNPFSMRSPSARAFFERRFVEFRTKAEKVAQPPLLAARRQQGAFEGSYHDAEFYKMFKLPYCCAGLGRRLSLGRSESRTAPSGLRSISLPLAPLALAPLLSAL
jgi:hypothetical protein